MHHEPPIQLAFSIEGLGPCTSLELGNLVVDGSLHELVRSHVLLDLWQSFESPHEGLELRVGVQNTGDHQPVLVEELVHGEIRHRDLTYR